MTPQGKSVLVFASSLGVSLGIIILASAFSANWWPMMMLVPFALIPLPMVFTETYGKQVTAGGGDGNSLLWYNYGMCLIGTLGIGLFAMPVVFLNQALIDGTSFALWLVATFISAGGSLYFMKNVNGGDGGGMGMGI
uniref:Uncharacterized protein n=1 Tax=Bicosoecida sp. CB-2014 TaxID=1486930 RepID=A0A7S1CJ06_9STRA|mmetsp:Transcript_28557/g.98619  ORF Transcript_28557/g.98619 Transcript_28557/m.98619 type:complete len:137 (+) Transcript_28557:256-666(+)